ncbi:F0F1 ATP synthase subunit gamma [Roseicitreum antarcticum]|jgi:F-type H+-transporting ATPase subunit gamma|uniref:F-type H+-transporting ATPase subunit gamma n=1 Tax=Roseicitreum antarcticum TaxID=564137 RepID=A0A1H3EKZ4_9RHOB|nr:FoF1 ATP synthase subunit gamma [Roseicitreum antarcticum]SDX79265.1 F-type H+-transporting ATPase subunit gamma [Roseicitreum antarcticum]
MAETLERLTRRTETMQSIRGIVRTMKTMSAINAAPYERAADAIDAWRDTVLNGLHAFLQVTGPLVQDSPSETRSILVVMGSDHGLCGNYNEVIATETLRHISPGQKVRILCVGAQMEDALLGEGIVPEVTLLPPANVDGLNRLADELVTRLDAMREDQPVTLIYTRRAAHGRQAPVAQQLLPLDEEVLVNLAARPWVSRSLPKFSLPEPALLAALVRNLLFATVQRAAAEALMTENAARLARMQQAEQSVDERLEDLQSETRSVRQSEITTELLDVIVGFEALKARDKRKRSPVQ